MCVGSCVLDPSHRLPGEKGGLGSRCTERSIASMLSAEELLGSCLMMNKSAVKTKE